MGSKGVYDVKGDEEANKKGILPKKGEPTLEEQY
jgi:hypothetical protein